MTDIETIREAARRMRTLARDATPGADPLPGGWAGFGANTDRVGQAAMFAGPAARGYRTGTVFSFDEHCQSCTPPTDADVQHVASWHPAVALAIADWLDAAAQREQEHRDRTAGRGYAYADPSEGDEVFGALIVARAFLGEQA